MSDEMIPYCQHLRWTESRVKVPEMGVGTVLVHRYCADCHELIHLSIQNPPR